MESYEFDIRKIKSTHISVGFGFRKARHRGRGKVQILKEMIHIICIQNNAHERIMHIKFAYFYFRLKTQFSFDNVKICVSVWLCTHECR